MRVRASQVRLALVLVMAPGCSRTAPARPQLVISVDTDAVVHDQLLGRPELSADAAIDTLRVDAIPAAGNGVPYDLRTFLAPSAEDWPISFGVPAEVVAQRGPVLLRIRAFRGALATPGELGGVPTLDPPRTATIDRLVEIDAPSEGVVRVRVVLREDCMAVPSTFGDAPTTCVDRERPKGTAREGVEPIEHADAAVSTLVGTWPGAVEIPCTGTPPAGAVCIPGGFSLLGAAQFEGFADGLNGQDSMPLHSVSLRPFFMDRTEVTVGVLQAAFGAGLTTDEPVKSGDPRLEDSAFCTWPGRRSAGNETLPANCITHATAEATCALRGGLLPSEAQWEHAARGRGQARLYPWGAEPASCCLTSVGRSFDAARPAECPGSGAEPVGSHAGSATCAGRGDVSRDGVLDLGGSVGEALRDWFQPFDAPCWTRAAGVLVDPVCIQDSATTAFSSRGGSWASGSATTASPFRYSFAAQRPSSGFRCVYPDAGTP